MADYNLGTARGKAEIDTKDVSGASKELKNADIVLRQTGQSLINFGTQAVQAFGYVIGIGAKFEKEMDFVQAVTNENATTMEALKQKAIELGKTGPFGPIALSTAFVELAKAGVSAQDIIDGVGQSVVNLAGAADITATDAGNIIVQIMNQFGIAAKDVPRATDIIAGAANASSIDVQDFATTLKYAGPVAKALGIDLEDLATTVALLGQSGIKGSQAGTSLRQTMLNLSGATPKAKERMKELGIITKDGSNIFYDAQGNVKDLTTVFGLLGSKLKGLNAQQKADALRDIFGVRQLPTVLFLMEQGTAKFDEFNAAINATTAADVANKRLDNLSGAIRKFKATLESVLLGPSGPFQDMLKNFVQAATQILLWFDRLPGPLKTFIIGSVGVIGVLSLMSGVFLLTVGNIVRMVRVFSELSTVASKLPGLISILASAVRGFTAALLTNPVFLIIAAIIALGVAFYLLYTRVQGFRDFIDKFWQSIQRFWDSALGAFKNAGDVIGRFFDNIGKAFDSFIGGFQNPFAKIGESVGGLDRFFLNFGANARKALDGILTGFKGLGSSIANVGKLIGSAFGTGVNLLQSFLGKLLDLPGLALKAFTVLLGAAGRFAAELPRLIGFAIGFIIGGFIRLQFELLKIVLRMWKAILKTFFNAAIQLPGIVWNIFTTLVKTAWDILTALPGIISNIFTSVMSFLWGLIPQIGSFAFQAGSTLLHGLWDIIAAIPGVVWDIFTSTINLLWTILANMTQLAFDIGNAILDGIITIITNLPGLVWDILTKVIDAFKSLITTAFNAARDFAKGLWDGFKDGLGINSPSFIEEALFNIQDETGNTAKMLDAQIRKMGLSGNQMISSVNSGALGLPTPAATAASGLGGSWNQNAPLIGEATIRDDRDIVMLARELNNERALQQRARGRRLVSAGT